MFIDLVPVSHLSRTNVFYSTHLIWTIWSLQCGVSLNIRYPQANAGAEKLQLRTSVSRIPWGFLFSSLLFLQHRCIKILGSLTFKSCVPKQIYGIKGTLHPLCDTVLEFSWFPSCSQEKTTLRTCSTVTCPV